jgi:hypothetical protein
VQLILNDAEKDIHRHITHARVCAFICTRLYTHAHLSSKGIQIIIMPVFQHSRKLMNFTKDFLEKCAFHGHEFFFLPSGNIRCKPRWQVWCHQLRNVTQVLPGTQRQELFWTEGGQRSWNSAHGEGRHKHAVRAVLGEVTRVLVSVGQAQSLLKAGGSRTVMEGGCQGSQALRPPCL